MKIVALDSGDVWVGTAISDVLGMFARPYKTIQKDELNKFLTQLFQQEPISTVIVGYPKTMSGTESEQTIKAIQLKEELEQQFPSIKWMLWDERLTSRQAAALKKGNIKTKEDKLQSHSIAAAFILESYLLATQPSIEEQDNYFSDDV